MRQRKGASILEDDPLWYKDAVVYELHVRAFYDSNGDGVGDFPGLTQKLDYLQDLGVTAIWLLPFYPSPLKDDGYDISEYTAIHPNYGTMRDFQAFLREAHRRGLRVITELVLNHTSDQHAWFQRARRARPGSKWREFYVWSDNPEKYKEARIIFKDFESSNWAWDPVAKSYYWHRFYSHQPDLNYDSPHVRKAMQQVMDFWLGLGVDGLRLDAVPYLFEREGTSCENLPETHTFLKEIRRHVEQRFGSRVLLAEANQWPEDAIGYFGEGDECHMAFHFPLMPRLFMGIRMEDRFPIIEILDQTPLIPDNCQWALFLRNHDELTLEMVTDEDRDYMYRVYAQDPQARINLGIRRRLAPLLGNHRRRIELMNGLLFSLPGTPFLYYGDEMGMGDNIYLGDRNAVRTPMHWSPDRNAGFSRANPHRLYLPVIIEPEYHYEALNAEAQQSNLHSLLWWMKRLISISRQFKAFARGTLEFLHPENRRVLVFVRRYQDELILIVANLSRFVQCVELDLAEFNGMVPLEIFGRTRFPPIGDLPYFFTLGPHTFYWFALVPQRAEVHDTHAAREGQDPELVLSGSWGTLFRGKPKAALEGILPNYLMRCRWFGGKARAIQSVAIVETIPMPRDEPSSYVILCEVRYTEGDPETYVLPLSFAPAEHVAHLQDPQVAVTRLRVKGKGEDQEGVLYDALWDKGFSEALLEAISQRLRFRGSSGEIVSSRSRAFRPMLALEDTPTGSSILKAEQSNTSVVYGDRFILKLLRRLESGVNPDLEIGRFLTDKKAFAHIPAIAGALEYRHSSGGMMTVAVLHRFVPNQGDAWRYTLDSLGRYFEAVIAGQADLQAALIRPVPLLTVIDEETPSLANELIGSYLEMARLLGQRTAELHVALAQDRDDPDFAPEPFTVLYQQSLYQSMRTLVVQAFRLLRQRREELPETVREEVQRVLDLEGEALLRLRSVVAQKMEATRIRCHGDYHLGQVLYTGKDFVIIDFEGEPARPLSERRIKRSPLRDVAGMLRSFHYASYAALSGQASGVAVRPEDFSYLEPWGRFWCFWVSVAFLRAYVAVTCEVPLLPSARKDLQTLLDAHLLEKAVYELSYELNNRPDWVRIPLQGILQLLEAACGV